MLPGSRFARLLMVLVVAIIVLGLIMSTCTLPVGL